VSYGLALFEYIGQRGAPWELKHLSTRRKRNQWDSVSSGERKRKSLNHSSLAFRMKF